MLAPPLIWRNELCCFGGNNAICNWQIGMRTWGPTEAWANYNLKYLQKWVRYHYKSTTPLALQPKKHLTKKPKDTSCMAPTAAMLNSKRAMFGHVHMPPTKREIQMQTAF